MAKSKKSTVPYSKEFGLYLRSLRKKRKISQSELGRQLGTTPQFICNWERGVSGPSFDTLVLVSKIFKVSEKEILKRLLNYQMKLYISEFNKSKNRLATK
ncbi:MAG: helix-turn-helix transcriptional regulator [Bdellovibrionota bacterium]